MKTLINSQRHTATERGIAGWTPLHYSARYGAEDVVKFLLSKGVGSEVDGKTTNQDTALHLAALAGHADAVRCLAWAGGDVQAMGTSRNYWSCNNAYLQALNARGQSAVHMAVHGANEDAEEAREV